MIGILGCLEKLTEMMEWSGKMVPFWLLVSAVYRITVIPMLGQAP